MEEVRELKLGEKCKFYYSDGSIGSLSNTIRDKRTIDSEGFNIN